MLGSASYRKTDLAGPINCISERINHDGFKRQANRKSRRKIGAPMAKSVSAEEVLNASNLRSSQARLPECKNTVLVCTVNKVNKLDS